LARQPRSAVATSSAGSDVGPEQMVSAHTLATVHEVPETADWFFAAFCRAVVT
jgi:hypothetical protein